jgi:hypothetical protein
MASFANYPEDASPLEKQAIDSMARMDHLMHEPYYRDGHKRELCHTELCDIARKMETFVNGLTEVEYDKCLTWGSRMARAERLANRRSQWSL